MKPVDALIEPMAKLGFRRRNGVYVNELADGVLGWVGFVKVATGIRDVRQIRPTVGVRHQELQRIEAELRGGKHNRWSPPTVSVTLAELMAPVRVFWILGLELAPEPAVETWRATTVEQFHLTDSREQAELLVAAIERYALPFMQAHLSLREIIDGLKHDRVVLSEYAFYRLPIAYWLAGDRRAALKSLAKLEARYDDATSARLRDHVTAFAGRFRAMVAAEEAS